MGWVRPGGDPWISVALDATFRPLRSITRGAVGPVRLLPCAPGDLAPARSPSRGACCPSNSNTLARALHVVALVCSGPGGLGRRRRGIGARCVPAGAVLRHLAPGGGAHRRRLRHQLAGAGRIRAVRPVRPGGPRHRQRRRQQRLQRALHPRRVRPDRAAAGAPTACPPGGTPYDRFVPAGLGAGGGRRHRPLGRGAAGGAAGRVHPVRDPPEPAGG